MFWISSGFLFRRVVSPFNKLDPRVKLAVSLEFFALSLAASSVITTASLIVVILLVAAIARSVKRIGRTMAFSLIFSVIIFAINVIAAVSLLKAFVYALRFLAIISSTSLFFITTSPDELEQIMKWMRIPRDVVFAFVTAVRFIPVVLLDAFQIMDAQKSRGLELEKGSLMKRARNLVPVLIPLVVNSVIRSGELAEAMESRGYGTIPKPTSLYGMSLRWYDWVVLLASFVLFAMTLYIYLFVRFPF